MTWALLLLLPTAVSAGETHLVINGVSHHINSSYEWNENHAGFGVEQELGKSSNWSHRVSANAFRDSNDDMSYMVGTTLHRRLITLPYLDDLSLSAGLTAFMMTRSDANDGMPFPGILPSLSLGNKDYGINITYMPVKGIEQMTDTRSKDPTLEGIIFAQFRISFDRIATTTWRSGR